MTLTIERLGIEISFGRTKLSRLRRIARGLAPRHGSNMVSLTKAIREEAIRQGVPHFSLRDCLDVAREAERA